MSTDNDELREILIEAGSSTTCVVLLPGGDFDDPEDRCGKPVIGDRGGFPMCQEHYDLFDPERTWDDD